MHKNSGKNALLEVNWTFWTFWSKIIFQVQHTFTTSHLPPPSKPIPPCRLNTSWLLAVGATGSAPLESVSSWRDSSAMLMVRFLQLSDPLVRSFGSRFLIAWFSCLPLFHCLFLFVASFSNYNMFLVSIFPMCLSCLIFFPWSWFQVPRFLYVCVFQKALSEQPMTL